MITTGDVLRVVLSFLMPDNVIAQMVTHYVAGTGVEQDPDDVLTAITAQLLLGWEEVELIVSDVVTGDLLKLSVYDIVLDQWDEVATTSATAFDGLAAANMLPHGAAAVVRFFTDIGRRQGRKFIPGMGEPENVDGTWTAGTVTAMALFGAEWDDVVTVNGMPFTQGVYDAALESFEKFRQSIAANTIVGYQRRRKSGVGI